MSKVDEAIVEMDAALAGMAAAHEGFRDLSRLNLTPDAMDVVRQRIAEYDRRTVLIKAGAAALHALVEDRYPELPIAELEPAVYADLTAQDTTIQAALATFAAIRAQELGLAGEAPELKGETVTPERAAQIKEAKGSSKGTSK